MVLRLRAGFARHCARNHDPHAGRGNRCVDRARITVTPAEHNDAQNSLGHGIGTSPATGTAVRRNSHLTLNISTGPRILPVPQVTGQPEATARTTLKDFTINATSISEFSDSTDAGKVIAVI